MPVLKYKCNDCGKEFAKIFFAEPNAPRACPVCHAENIAELGPAFTVDKERLRRALCVSCETCETGTCPAPVATTGG
jgi:putative FmdB family regulatory protein